MNNIEDLKAYISVEVLKLIEEKTNKDLLSYLLNEIMPLYKTLDKGHGIKHIGTVIDSSLKLAKFFDVNYEMILISAIYHDLGMMIDRKTHQTHSKEILIKDEKLNMLFTKEELTVMGEACEDHRASNKNEPRSIYGYILSDADRTTDIFDMIIRCYNFSIKNYNDKNYEELYNRVYSHLKEKYGEGGYAKFYLKESFEVIMKPYLEAQKILKDEDGFRVIYDKLIKRLN